MREELLWPRDALGRVFVRAVARLLWLANTRPPLGESGAAFYAVKRRILRRWGAPVGEDLQEITKRCFRCEGTGWIVDPDEGDDDIRCRCDRCTEGIYDQFWVRLTRWQVGRYVFHTPGDRERTKPEGEVTIRGRVTHALVPSHAPHEAVLWLGLLFDLAMFRRDMLRGSVALGWYWYPLSNLQRGLAWMRTPARWVRRCTSPTCERWMVRRPGWQVCRRCAGVTQDVPF